MMSTRINFGGGKVKVTLPAPATVNGKDWAVGVHEFAMKDAEAAETLANGANEFYEGQAAAAEEARKPKLQILSRDGKPVHGIPTLQATDRAAYVAGPKAKNPGAVTSELDLVKLTGYVLVQRNGDGSVGSGYGDPADFARFRKVTPEGIQALRDLLNGRG